MAEFQEVMRQAARLCNYMDNKCTCCPLTTEAFCQSCANEMENFPGVEKAIMSWAAEHPEPVYPTWGEWLESEGICFSRLTNYEHVHGFTIPKVFEYQIDGKTAFICGDRVNSPIPDDIAEKLGLQPKEG